ncbi:hypothetical protein [Bradyrhizobium sp. AT1]|uniref:hypothetical protein n=1 Tax=Bradyrhizobium sp. AT1 TaxID=574934 RepID=UPI000A7DE414|nr:hypothetical protein [Bradyrhizobium sp. AT1]
MALAELLIRYGRAISVYSKERPNFKKGILYALTLFGALAIAVCFFVRLVFPVLQHELFIRFVPMLVVIIVIAIAVTLKAEISPLGLDVGCFAKLFLIAMFPIIVQFYICRFLWIRTKFHLLPSPVGQIAKSGQPFCLYLRSFVDDEKSAKESVDFSDDPFRFARYIGSHITVQDRIESVLSEQLVPHIPTLCIGRPRERYPSSSFARVFVDDEQWQYIAQALLQASRIVIARVGETHGFRWELTALREGRLLKKTILFFCTAYGLPFTRTQIQEAMTAHELGILDADVPWESYFCVFDGNDQPTFLPAALPSDANPNVRIRASTVALILYLIDFRPDLLDGPEKTNRALVQRAVSKWKQ